MNVRIITSAYDTGHYERRMGRGPGCLLRGGLAERLEVLGHQVAVVEVDPKPDLPAEIATSFAVMGGIALEVEATVASGAFPLVLAGNCNSAVGTVSGLAPRRVGVVWFDAHADFNTPESGTTGFLDGMGLAILSGHCWRALAACVAGYTPVPEENVILSGARDIDPLEAERLSRSRITVFSDRDLAGDTGVQRFGEALDRLARRVDGVYLHIDLDVHDPQLAPANHFRPPGGLSPDRLRDLVSLVSKHAPVLAAYVGAYDPEVDPQGVTREAALRLIETMLSSSGITP